MLTCAIFNLRGIQKWQIYLAEGIKTFKSEILDYYNKLSSVLSGNSVNWGDRKLVLQVFWGNSLVS